MTFEYVCFAITNQCNLSCPYCYRLGSNSLSQISKKDFEICIRKLKELGCRVVNITGGEPLLHPDWKLFIEMARFYGLSVILSTNGLLLDIDDPILDNVSVLTIPLDGYNQEVNSKTRGYKHYEHAISIINCYKSGTFPFRLKINTVMTRYNFNTLSYISKIIDNDIIWKVFSYKNKGVYNCLPTNAIVSEEDYLKKICELNTLPMRGVFMFEDCMKSIDGTSNYTIVDSTGDLYLSQNMSDMFIDNLVASDTSSIMQIINDSNLKIVPYKSLNGLDEMFL